MCVEGVLDCPVNTIYNTYKAYIISYTTYACLGIFVFLEMKTKVKVQISIANVNCNNAY